MFINKDKSIEQLKERADTLLIGNHWKSQWQEIIEGSMQPRVFDREFTVGRDNVQG